MIIKFIASFHIYMLFFSLVLIRTESLAFEEEQLLQQYDSVVAPYFNQNFKQSSFVGKKNIAIQYAFKQEQAAEAVLIVLGGRTEFFLKYQELFYDLRTRNYSIYSYDHRGQGLSERILDDSLKGYVDDFEDYVDDLQIFIETIVRPGNHQKIFILAHSMGGLAATLYCKDNPGVIAGLIAVSPMFAINTSPYPQIIAEWISTLANFLGFEQSYIIGGKAYDKDKAFSDNDVTTSQARFELTKKIVTANPKTMLGSPTFGWLKNSFTAMKQSINLSKNVQTNMLILQGLSDSVVDIKSQDNFCEQALNCTIVTIENAQHEILMENDNVRNKALKVILSFIERNF